LHQPAAVETRRIRAAEAIWHATKRERKFGHRAPVVAMGSE
jgi:hypothetical protein